MATFLTDVHTHSTFSPDGRDTLETMVKAAVEKNISFYGVSEHIDYDIQVMGYPAYGSGVFTNEDEYMHAARHLQDDYAGVINLLVGMEFGYSDEEKAIERYQDLIKKHAPDFIVNSIHTLKGKDYYYGEPYYTEENGQKKVREKDEVYKEYLALLLRSIRVDYPYDIIGHLSYPIRYAPYEDRKMHYEEYSEELDEILKEIIQRDKILEINSSCGTLAMALPERDILQRYYDLGGRKISYASDAHFVSRIADKREEVVALLKEIGFTYVTVPCKGEHIKVEI